MTFCFKACMHSVNLTPKLKDFYSKCWWWTLFDPYSTSDWQWPTRLLHETNLVLTKSRGASGICNFYFFLLLLFLSLENLFSKVPRYFRHVPLPPAHAFSGVTSPPRISANSPLIPAPGPLIVQMADWPLIYGCLGVRQYGRIYDMYSSTQTTFIMFWKWSHEWLTG